MKIKDFFAPPTFVGDEERTQQATLLNTAWWIVFPVPFLMLIGNILGHRTPAFVSSLNIVFLITWLYIRNLMHQGQIKEGSFAAVSLGMIVITATSIGLGTVRTPAALGYMPMILFAGFFFGRKGVNHTVITVSLLILGLIVAERNGFLREPDYTVGGMQWIAYTAFFTITGYITMIFFSHSQKHLKRAREEIEKRKETENSLKIFSRIAEQIPVSIVVTDKNGFIEFVNPKFIEITGYSFEEAYRQNPRILKSGHHSKSFYKDLWHTIQSGNEWHGVFQNKKKNGELYWEKASISPIFNAKNEITHYTAVKEDVTEQQEDNQKLKEHLKKIETLQETLKKQALRDPLTGLYNRRYMEERIKQDFVYAKREGLLVSVILLDLDHLKKINDIGGHATGDHALRTLAAQLRASTRKNDTVCRYGGDEFAIILPNTTCEEALARTEELRRRMRELTLLYRSDEILRISFTAGIASFPTHGHSSEAVFKCADIALYRAKEKGRDRVEIFSLDNKESNP